MNRITGIYRITSPTNKIYIGQSIDIKERFESYRCYDCKKQQKLYASLKKYGFNNHKFDIIRECDEHELNDFEIFYINFYDTFNTSHGLNLRHGGGAKGRHSEESKARMSLAQIGNKNGVGRVVSEETKEKIRIANTGFKWDDERKRKASEQRKGRKRSEESIKKTAYALRGRKLDPDVVKKSVEAKKKMYAERRDNGIKTTWSEKRRLAYLNNPICVSDEVKKKRAESLRKTIERKKAEGKNLGREWTDEQRNKLSKSIKGHPSYTKGMKFSEETRKKMSESTKAWWNKRKLEKNAIS